MRRRKGRGAGIKVKETPNLNVPRRAMDTATRESARLAGRLIKEEVQKLIPPGGGVPAGKFTGEWATGRLRRDIVAQGPKKLRKNWRLRVGLRSNSKAAIYAPIHEFGGIIVPVRAKMLRWEDKQGNPVFAMRSRIRKKAYFATGYRKGARRFRQEAPGKFRRHAKWK